MQAPGPTRPYPALVRPPVEVTRNRALCNHCKLTNIRPLRFVLIFACCLLIGFGVLLTPPVQSVDVEFSRALVSVSHGLIRMCGGHAHSGRRDPARSWRLPDSKGDQRGICVLVY